MDALERSAERVARALALLGSLGLLAMLVHVGLDVATRNLMDRPIPATNEIVSRYYMVLIAFLPLAWVERNGAMVKVELFEMLASDRIARISDMLVGLLCAAIYAVLAWVTWADALKNWKIGSFVDVLGMKLPVWPTYFLPPAGFALATLVVLIRVASLLRRPG